MAYARHIGMVALALVGCGASTTVQVMGRNAAGEAMVRITCTRTMDVCYQRAAVACRFGFTPVNEGGESGPAVAQTRCDGFGNCYSVASQRFTGSLIVACTKGTNEQRAAALAKEQRQ